MSKAKDKRNYDITHQYCIKIATFLLLFYVFSSIVLVIKFDIKDFSVKFNENYAEFSSTIISNVITALLCTYLIISLIKKNERDKSAIKEILIFFFIFSAMPSYIIGFHYLIPANDSILVEFNLISPQFLIPGATYFLAFFIIEIFYQGLEIKENKIRMRLIALLCFIASALNFFYMIYGIGPEKTINTANIINNFYYFLILPMYVFFYLSLMLNSSKLSERIDDKNYRQGIKLLGISGATLGIVYLIRIVIFIINPLSSLIMQIINSTLDLAVLGGYILLYLGIVLPSIRNKSSVETSEISKMMEKIIKKQKKEQTKNLTTDSYKNIEQTRLKYEKTANMMKVSKEVIIDRMKINEIDAELISPKNNPHPNESSNIILYLHGGGFLYCSINTHRGLASLIVEQTQIPLLIIDYRRAPENKFPAALEDVLECYNWLLEEKSYSPEQIIIGGDSAGGGLTMASLLKLKELKNPLPKAAFLISPWLDLTLSGESFENKKDLDAVLSQEELKLWASKYIGDQDSKNPYISPLFGDLSDLPPIFIQVGTSELLFTDSSRLYEKLQVSNNKGEIIVWDQMLHAFPLFAAIKFVGKFIAESNESLKKIKSFIEKVYS